MSEGKSSNTSTIARSKVKHIIGKLIRGQQSCVYKLDKLSEAGYGGQGGESGGEGVPRSAHTDVDYGKVAACRTKARMATRLQRGHSLQVIVLMDGKGRADFRLEMKFQQLSKVRYPSVSTRRRAIPIHVAGQPHPLCIVSRLPTETHAASRLDARPRWTQRVPHHPLVMWGR